MSAPEPFVPPVLPVFPLNGWPLFPGLQLPLHVFEPRYRHMVEDALGGEPFIGMIQPLERDPEENRPPRDAPPSRPELYEVGCVGKIEHWSGMKDGRFLITLRGVRRFRAVRELPLRRGYRRFEADYTEFARDLRELEAEFDASPLLAAFDVFRKCRGIDLDVEQLRGMPPVRVLNGLSIALPFAPAEKQALLEAPDVDERQRILLSLLDMGARVHSQPEAGSAN